MSSPVRFTDRGHATVYQPIDVGVYGRYYANTALPIVIDNGTFECRAGFANAPAPSLRFRPFVGKTKYKKDPDHIRVGHQLREKDINRLKARTPFDGQLISYFETVELVLDYIFASLGLSASSSIPHPILMTEPLAQPNYSRSHMSELLFECYNAPAVTYAIDSLLAYQYLQSQQAEPSSTALLISHGYESTTVIPLVDDRPQLLQSARLSVGCHAQHSMILNDLSLDFPEHKAHLTEGRAQELCEDYAAMVTEVYDEELRKMAIYDVNPGKVVPPPTVRPVVIQLPFVLPVTVVETEAELKAKEQKRPGEHRRQRSAAIRSTALTRSHPPSH